MARSEVFSYFVLCGIKISLMLTTRVTHLHSLPFILDDVNSAVRRVNLAISAKLVPTE